MHCSAAGGSLEKVPEVVLRKWLHGDPPHPQPLSLVGARGAEYFNFLPCWVKSGVEILSGVGIEKFPKSILPRRFLGSSAI